MPLIITDEMRSMIAGAVIAGSFCDHQSGVYLCFCCGEVDDCSLIVGKEYAHALQHWMYEGTGCSHPENVDDHLQMVGELDVLYTEEELARDAAQ